MLEIFFLYDNAYEEAEKLREKYQISKKRFLLTKLRIMIKKKDLAIINTTISEIDKLNFRKPEIPYEIVADLLHKAEYTTLAAD